MRVIISYSLCISAIILPSFALASSDTFQISQAVFTDPPQGAGGIVPATTSLATSTTPTYAAVTYINIIPSDTSAIIEWDTSVPTTANVSWGSQDGFDAGSQSETSSKTTHSIVIDGLLPDTKYALDLNSLSSNNTSSVHNSFTFTTTPTTDPIITPKTTFPQKTAKIYTAPSQSITSSVSNAIASTTTVNEYSVSSTTTANDACPNITDIQAFVPQDMYRDASGNCISVLQIENASTTASIQNNTKDVITYSFIPESLQMPVSSPIMTSIVRFFTDGETSTAFVNDPAPSDPSIPVDATGSILSATIGAITIGTILRFAILLFI